ncbi:flavodoxin-like protein [Anaerobacterium chartisolvens]|uniref:Flavodoxin-like protein n=1 Tax=Anaerobacterium chartisolvens TaxID=1297424 RepID=A0A369BJY6_9FIRM|nr:EFR1 family ferrodoxin [Anaerobacterium chartisolvens]RCX20928.1 flavodoxin-like protein [Anaerobacterium chartisolvens]
MKTNLYYFSGTGNSLDIARNLANELGDTQINAIANAVKGEGEEIVGDIIGIIFPVYWYGMPLLVLDFIKKVKRAKYIFIIATYGDDSGSILTQSRDVLKNCGLSLGAAFLIKMPENYTPMYQLISEKEQKELFEAKAQEIKQISEIIKKRKVIEVTPKFFVYDLFYKMVYKIYSPKFKKLDKKFWVDSNCNSCKVCMKVCPVSNIDWANEKPKWKNACQQCFACFHWCPKEAIQFGGKTKGRKRYRNPNVKMEDFFIHD